MQKVDLKPFTKIAWKSKEAKEIWAERILRISRAYHNAEYLLVKKKIRPCAVIHISWNAGVDELIERITTDRLFYLPIRWSKKYSGFSHKHFFTQKGDPDSFIYGVLSYDLDYAKQFRDAELGDHVNHEKIGELLGYPKCCTEAFIDRWSKGIFDPVFEAAEIVATKKEKINGTEIIHATAHPYANPFLRYFGVRITSHLPCTIQCEETKKIGEKWIQAMRELDEEAAKWAVEILSMPIKWSVLKGIVQVETPLFFGITNSIFTEHKKEVWLNDRY